MKCLVWDLDNTLWAGTLLEGDAVHLRDGVREVVTTLDARGILQSVSSKNDHDLAWTRLEELGIAEYFVLPRIGWNPKSASVRAIADELKFAERAMAFVDDQPAERAEVAFHLPQVRCYRHDQVSELLDLPEFATGEVTPESRNRRQLYQAGFARETARSDFTGSDESFLRSLELQMTITRADDEKITRVAELTLRTSQMNATGVHYPDPILRALMAADDHEVLVVSMADRFGSHGAVGVLMLATGPVAWHLKLLATSCRVVSLGAGAAILNWLIDQAHRAAVHLIADFRATDRNRMMEIAYRFAGFTGDTCPCLIELGEGNEPDAIRLHLVPEERPAPQTIALTAVDLTTPPPA